MVTDELGEFCDEEIPGAKVESGPGETVICDLLVFEYGECVFAVPAQCVDGVVPWKSPAVVPGIDERVSGVIQDRGRIVVVMAHPSGQIAQSGQVTANRIIICSTSSGYVGLPATTTTSVGPVELSSKPIPSSVYDSQSGPFTYLDPDQYSQR